MRLWHAVVVIATGVAVALVATAALPPTGTRLVADLTGLLGALAAAVAFAVTGSRRGERWRGWLAAALALWAAAQGLWTWHRYAGGLAATFPDVENALYLGLPIFTFLAIVRGTRRCPSPGRPEDVVSSRRVLVLDGLIIVASFVALSWEVTFGTLLNGRFSGTLLLAVSYTLGDLVLIVLVILSAVALQNIRRVPMVWLVFGLVAIGTSDTLFAYAISREITSPPWADIGYMIGPVLLLFAATAPDRALSQFRPRLPLLFLPYVPLSAVLLIRLISSTVLETPDPTSMIAGYLVGLVVGLVVLRQLVTLRQLYAAHQQLHHQATHDHLAGAANRALLLEHLAAALARARRQGHHVGLLYVDLNHFKRVNDAYGHAAGDAVLYACAKRLQTCARESDLVARVGGDEFVLVLEPAPADPTAIKERLRSELRQPVQLSNRVLEEIGASVGYVPVDDGDSPVLALAHADEAMYEEKQVPPGSSS